ncbi:NAD-dependent epimerase/dehydratase family protein [Kitasatospora purpeofusca]|uniref:NAD-dependent epimerase/dehydratase family protein n=1 Tax=Kitasatospora purpeofusca TaxID=67352 RepID=UPI002A599221|nr:NAD-dependent epimerase/dehydratase family protein [Kitasatospora purpeofusca]MDY0812016.1 NAD-dependent epimerase/dehydratase family protein [Kitasatospora purpeofusca]
MSGELLLVTGGAGFIGSHLVEALLRDRPEALVVSVDSYATGSTENHTDDPRARYLTGETGELGRLWAENGLLSPGTVFHLGEYSRVDSSFDDLDLVWRSNLHGTKEVVDFCRRHGARLVYAGSSTRFGQPPHDEHSSPYAWMKAKNVEYIRNTARWYELDYVITYFYNVYGPRQIRQGPYATVIGVFEEQRRRGVDLTVVEPGSQLRDFTHVDDIVSGLLVCAARGAGDGYLLGRGEEHRIIDVARMFGGPVCMIPARRGDRVRSASDFSKARALGWTPTIRLRDYISRLDHPDPRPGPGTATELDRGACE